MFVVLFIFCLALEGSISLEQGYVIKSVVEVQSATNRWIAAFGQHLVHMSWVAVTELQLNH